MSSFVPRLRQVVAGFSVEQLMRTLFEPWRRIVSYPGASLEEKMKAWGDNLFSRLIGFVVRSAVLFAGFVVGLLVAIFTLLEMVVWPLLPLAIPVLIVMGFR